MYLHNYRTLEILHLFVETTTEPNILNVYHVCDATPLEGPNPSPVGSFSK